MASSSSVHAPTQSVIDAFFPVPQLLAPSSMGVDISDSSIKWLVLEQAPHGFRVAGFGDTKLPEGIVVGGTVRDVAALGAALAPRVDASGGVRYAHAALPEEAAYVFSMHAPQGSSRDQILKMIEFEFEGRVPIKPSAAVYDYDIIDEHDAAEGIELAVTVFPKDLAESYAAAFSVAGIELLSLEIEARSIARAVSSGKSDEPITLLVDFGGTHTGFAVLKRGIPIFTSTVEVGGNAMLRGLADKLGISYEEAQELNNEQGLTPQTPQAKQAAEVLTMTAAVLADEVTRHYRFWDTRRDERGDRMTPVARVLLVGGNANLKGLGSYIAGRVQAPTERGNVWLRVGTFDEYIPPIDWRASLQFATAIGLALRGA
jgi:type IV pilus assembly protein PilM